MLWLWQEGQTTHRIITFSYLQIQILENQGQYQPIQTVLRLVGILLYFDYNPQSSAKCNKFRDKGLNFQTVKYLVRGSVPEAFSRHMVYLGDNAFKFSRVNQP